MTRIAKQAGRRYRSRLRDTQAEATRAGILDATVRVMARGLADVSMPAVAREAGVSVPTVYRHFGTKRELFAALQPHLHQRAGIDVSTVPASIGELGGTLRTLLARMDDLDDVMRAALASPASEEVRRVHTPNRLRLVRRIADSIAPQLPPAERDRIARLLLILTSSSALRTWRDHLGSSIDEVAEDIDVTVRAAIAWAEQEG